MKRLAFLLAVFLAGVVACTSGTSTLTSPAPTLPSVNTIRFRGLNFQTETQQVYTVSLDGTNLQPVGESIGIGVELHDNSTSKLSPDSRWASTTDNRGLVISSTLAGDETFQIPIYGSIHELRWSPDSQQIAFAAPSLVDSDIDTAYILDVTDRDLLMFSTDDSLDKYGLAWSPTGDLLAYVAGEARKGCSWPAQVRVYSPVSGAHQPVLPGFYASCSPAWSPLGDSLAIAAAEHNDDELGIYRVGGDGRDVTMVSGTLPDACCAVWSPDGQFIAFQAGKDNLVKIYVAKSDGSQVWRLTNLPDEIIETDALWQP